MRVKSGLRFVVFWLSCAIFSLAYAAESVSPVGNWTKVDPVTKEPEAIIQIWEDQDHTVFGKVKTVFSPEKNKTLCEDCPEDFKNKPVVGMEVLWDLKQVSDYTWSDGKVLSPKLGKVFPCNMTMSQDSQTLTIRAYANTDLKLLGRTQTWYRAAS